MKPIAYPLLALLAFVVANTGFDILARMDIAGEPFRDAAAEHLRYASTGLIGTIFILAPFLVVGWICAAVEKRDQTRSAILIFALGIIPLLYFYYEGHRASQQVLADEKWTAAALSVGVLPFFVGIPVMLLVGGAAALAMRRAPPNV